MGMSFQKTDNSIIASGSGNLQAIEIDMSEMPDVVQTLAVMACFASGTTLITNIAHLAYKESNRIKDTATEIKKTGINIEFGEDFLRIEGGVPHAAEIETYEDHRMAMSMALLGCKTKGITILDHKVVNKSFPKYWEMMSYCGLDSKLVKLN
jgi:3-phosphoshikimate 1-carboxyvinyltransferase